MLHLGAFPSESSGHFSEYLPYFRKRPDLIKRYTRDGYLGESGYYANNWPTWRAENDEEIRKMLSAKRSCRWNGARVCCGRDRGRNLRS